MNKSFGGTVITQLCFAGFNLLRILQWGRFHRCWLSFLGGWCLQVNIYIYIQMYIFSWRTKSIYSLILDEIKIEDLIDIYFKYMMRHFSPKIRIWYTQLFIHIQLQVHMDVVPLRFLAMPIHCNDFSFPAFSPLNLGPYDFCCIFLCQPR